MAPTRGYSSELWTHRYRPWTKIGEACFPCTLHGGSLELELELELINKDNRPSFDLSNYEGHYSQKGYGMLSIFMKNGHLYGKLPFTTFRLIHDSGDDFTSTFTEEVPTIMTSPWLRFSFIKEVDGVTGVRLNILEGGEVFQKSMRDEGSSCQTIRNLRKSYLW